MPVHPRRWSLARQLLLLQVGLVVVVVTLAAGLAVVDADRDARESTEQQVVLVARSVADSPDVAEALTRDDPSLALQPYAEQVRRDTGTDFVVVMSPDRTRYSHPDPEQIGRSFLGTVEPALAGRTFTETFEGTLGPSVRAVTPVADSEGRVVGLVSVGLSVGQIGSQLRAELPLLIGSAMGVLLLAVLGSLLLGRRLQRLTYGLGPEELARMYSYYDGVLHAVREGLLVLDRSGRVQLANDEARRLLELPDDPDLTGRPVDGLGLPGGLVAVLQADGPVADELHPAHDRVLVVSAAPAVVDGTVRGRVVTLRDHTDLLEVTGERDSARGLAESLRAQAHEAANRLHTVVSLLELGRVSDAVDFAVDELAEAQALTDLVVGAVEEPVVAAVLLGKSAVAAERGVELVVAAGTELDADGLAGSAVAARDLVTVLGNLLDNAVDAALDGPAPRRVEVGVRRVDGSLVLHVTDSGPGLDPSQAEAAFTRGWSTKAVTAGRLHGRGLGLALVGQTVHRLDGTVEVSNGTSVAGGAGGATFTVRLPLAVRA